MTYETAKKLKDAGFPQKMQGNFIGSKINDETTFLRDEEVDIIGYIYAPTLSELIEACGKEFISLDSPIVETNTQWSAIGMFGDDRLYRKREGSTPEEAVAMLWLELYKK